MYKHMARNGVFLSFMVLMLFVGCSRSASNGETTTQPGLEAPTKRIASADVVKIIVEPVEITSGGSGEARVRLTIQSGYHVNANPPTFSYLIPTELAITPAEGLSAGAISYPPPITAKFSFSEKPLAVYEGEVEIRAIVKAGQASKPGQHSLAAKLSIQACDDQVCYPPGTRELTIPVVIK
ncbi:MAG TPA: protein-disulfide reductase DsbD N-terminal domain-containing protein [Pyrinomonadaceae bacterium]|nr:protein-disulfide reductase DsbD N-terminal domain-containing protein [Pyrinomonadaceae bacterium]